ncbi:BREX-1 system adenine-specific DNA-methyltransferase PglX [Xylanibacter ruminicola]|uniref:site-specific DNA-methyltransferase (adenine-specific) n=1 Tax=Xylanibacter ruminicola TaxID=839 RepID=A0A1M6UFW7_XYLRU|nr:BREX-1 system adenine-specific DNA-methyltransferase PglX [Xylanibacter ruminicola]SHK68077.1 N-6 DNA Methylase [Xylanibacter ruminicola]
MDTNRIKKFATEARNKLKAGIAAKIITLGFDKNGNVPEHMHPQLMQGGSLWNGQLQTEGFYYQWMALYDRVQKKGIKEVYEEAAYTWFNRLVAIRILMKNQLIEPVLAYVDAARTPRIVDEARMGRVPQMQERQRQLLMELLDDDSKITEQFAILVTAFCHDNPILFKCFGAMSDYTELLLPNDILTEGGFIDLLNHTEFITDDDFHSPELIGWLYQFYISERKDEVFAKKGKFEADEIPAATQIFTPNWIVKYMVQNTIGRIYLDNNPSAASEFKPKWQYLVEPSTPTPKEAIYKYKELTDLLVGDLACGSGHILNECFDLLYDLYIYEGYSRREAVEYIFTYNLRGIDLDTRAKQLATFALMLKACQKDSAFADAHILPKVLNMPTPIPQEQVSDRLIEFFRETPSSQIHKDLTAAFELMQDADSLGSIMKFELAESTQLAIRQIMVYWQKQGFIPEPVKAIMPAMDLILTLTEKYAALVMNPPYMGNSNMNEVLSNYVKKNYEKGKADLCTAFMIMQAEKTSGGGYYANIIPPSWMFLSTFEGLRRSIIDNQTIQSLLHLSRGIFGADFGSVSTVIHNRKTNNPHGTYFRLIERTFQEFDQKHLRMLFEKTLENHDFRYFFADYSKDVDDIHYNKNGARIFYPNISQNNFEGIPGCPIGYWISDRMRAAFDNSQIKDIADSRQGMATTNNDRFLKLWFEVDISKIGFGMSSEDDTCGIYKWFPYNKGGAYRKWYGNNDYVVNFYNRGKEVCDYIDSHSKVNHKGRVINRDKYFQPNITWSALSSDAISLRYTPKGSIFDTKGQCIFTDTNGLKEKLMAYLNSRVSKELLKVIAPTLDYNCGVIAQMPYKDHEVDMNEIQSCIDISKQDWDSHETSWDFDSNPIVALRNAKVAEGNLESSFKISTFMEQFKSSWKGLFNKLRDDETDLNRQFLNIYGLEDELSPEVKLSEITILQQGEINIDNEQVTWNEDVLMKQLISYAVGVWMGRYKLGTKGLHIAYPNPTDKELQEYWYGGVQVYIDDDGLIPVLPQSSPFDDNLSSRISDFVRITFGEDKLTENLNYIEQKLGTSIDQYVQKDFWKDHKKMYQNRPIYWLFSSSKGAFKCLAYMHRMNAYTAERVRSNYLLPYIEFLQNQIGEMENRRAALSTTENRKLQNFQKALDECREYHERLQVVAEQAIAFDLDDGVVVNYAKFGDVLAKIK